MPTLSLDLKFVAYDDEPGLAIAQVVVKEWTEDKAGQPAITPEAAGPSELDGYIDTLKEELEQIRKKGHRKFAEQHERWRKISKTSG